MFTDYIYNWLENALDFGVSEFDFWNMTFAELNRLLSSKKRMLKEQEKKQASFDYILADLIGRSVARVYNSSNKMPTLSEAYPSLFDEAEEKAKIQEQKNELSAIRFKQFAQTFNKKFAEVSNKDE